MNVYAGGLRGNSKKIYILPPSQLTDTLLYDFDLFLGDTLPPSYINDTSMLGVLRVIQIDTLLIGNQYRKKFTLSPFPNNCFLFDTVTWIIEGIGHRQGFINAMFCEFEVGCGINCYSEFGGTVFPDTSTNCSFTIDVHENNTIRSKSLLIYPNPSRAMSLS